MAIAEHVGSQTERRVLAVSEDYDRLARPLRWLARDGFEIQAVLGPGSIGRLCRLLEAGAPEIVDCDLIVTDQAPTIPGLWPHPREIVRDARSQDETVAVLVVRGDADHEVAAIAACYGVRVARPRRGDVLRAARSLVTSKDGTGKRA